MNRRLSCCLSAALLVVVGTSIGSAQVRTPPPSPAPPPAQADGPPTPPPVAPPEPGGDAPPTAGGRSIFKLSLNSGVVRQHESGAWSTLGVAASNPLSEAQEGVIAVFDPQHPAKQYARKVWVPAGARRHTWLPFQVPAGISPEVQRQNLMSMQLDRTGRRETIQRREGDPLANPDVIAVSHDGVKSASLLRKPHPTEQDEQLAFNSDDDAWATLMAARETRRLSQSANDMSGDFLPPWPEALEAYEQFLLTSDRIRYDAAGAAALRSWVREGGRLWILLDRVAPETVAMLLGDAADYQVVDRVELDTFELESADVTGRLAVKEPCEYERPVELVRVVTTAVDVPCRVNGWPAAIWIPFGEGEVLLTALAPRGWTPEGSNQARQALETLSARLLGGREPSVDLTALERGLEQRIGYRVPSRSIGAGVLGVYCLTLLGGGTWLYRRGRAERLVVLAAAATVVASGILIAVGARNSTRTPATVAFTQLVQTTPETGEATVQSLAALYDQQNRPIVWRAGRRGWALPDDAEGTETRRLVWNDDDGVESQNAVSRAGAVVLARTRETRTFERPFAARVRFGPQGLEGRVEGDLTGLDSPVIVAPPSASLATTVGPDGRLSAAPEDVLPADRYTAEAFVNDQQRRRQELMRSLLDPTDSRPFPKRPSLLFWRPSVESSVEPPPGYQLEGEALVVAPLEFERTAPGESFRIPSTFLKILTSAGGSGQSLAYNGKTGQWVAKLTTPTESTLVFQTPSQVLPCDLRSGRLTVRITAPSRELRVESLRDGKRHRIAALRDPSGVYDFSLDAADLTLDELGRFTVVLSVGPTARQTAEAEKAARGEDDDGSSRPFVPTTWQIDYVRMTVDGTTRRQGGQP